MNDTVFDVRFHQPFLIASGHGAPGYDAVGVPGEVVPGSSLKGAMRHSALHVLGLPEKTVGEVFGVGRPMGEAGGGSPWAWTNLGPADAFQRWSRHRNRVDQRTGTAHSEALTTTEEIWQLPQAAASFAVEQLLPIGAQRKAVHLLVLQASAFGVTALGGGRNRSMGTVTIRPHDAADPADLTKRISQLQRSESEIVR